MKKIRKYKNIIERFLSGESGQRFFNFAYSIGAAIVIWGALFKILHLKGGELLLCIGMGTEVLMFILTAFDRPGRDYHWEEVFPQLANKESSDSESNEENPAMALGHSGVVSGGPVVYGGAVYAGAGNGGSVAASSAGSGGYVPPVLTGEPSHDVAAVTDNYIASMSAIAEKMNQLQQSTEALNKVSETLLASYQAITDNSDSISESSAGYVEQMQSLNRNINGLNTIYEIQLKSVSSQIDAIDRVNRGIKEIRDMYERSASQSTRYCEETEKMARYMQQLNKVYENMIHAMTINMYHPTMAMPDVPPHHEQQTSAPHHDHLREPLHEPAAPSTEEKA